MRDEQTMDEHHVADLAVQRQGGSNDGRAESNCKKSMIDGERHNSRE